MLLDVLYWRAYMKAAVVEDGRVQTHGCLNLQALGYLLKYHCTYSRGRGAGTATLWELLAHATSYFTD